MTESTSKAPEVDETETEETTEVKGLTPYGAHNLVNQRLETEGLQDAKGAQKRIPPQMMYNYTKGRVKAGKKPFIDLDDDGFVVRESLEAWINRYVDKLKATAIVAKEAAAKESADSTSDEPVEDEA